MNHPLHQFHWKTPSKRPQMMGQFNPITKPYFSSTPYINSKGVKKIGYGFNMDSNRSLPRLVKEGKRPITKQEADAILEKMNSKKKMK